MYNNISKLFILRNVMFGLSADLVSKHMPTGVEQIDGRFLSHTKGRKQSTATDYKVPYLTEIANLWKLD